MVLNLSRLNNDNIIISNTDDKFVGTELEMQDFTIEVKRLDRAATIDISMGALDADGKIQTGKFSKLKFIGSIVEAVGFKDENGNDIGEAQHIKELIWEYSPDSLLTAIKEAIASYDITDEKKSDSLESDSQLTQTGQS